MYYVYDRKKDIKSFVLLSKAKEYANELNVEYHQEKITKDNLRYIILNQEELCL